MQFYCDKEKAQNGEKATNEKSFPITVKKDCTESQEDVKVCQQYFEDKSRSAKIGGSISFLIIAVNQILKTAIIELITWIGEDTISE
jgi:hypothetical protein